MTSLTASDIMARSETTQSLSMDIYEALGLLLKKKLTGASVVDKDGELLGMLTERDCLKVLVAGELDGWPAGRQGRRLHERTGRINWAECDSLRHRAHVLDPTVPEAPRGRR